MKKKNVVGEYIYVFVIDLNGDFHFLTGKIKTYIENSLVIVESWDDEDLGKNLRVPKRFYAQASYSLFPRRKFESMANDVRMFGFELKKLRKEWSKYWLRFAKVCFNLSDRFAYYAELPFEKELM